MKTIGTRLKNLRQKHNFSIDSVADLLEIKPKELEKIESNDKTLTVSQLEILSDLYLVNDEYILYGEDSNIHLKDYYQQDLNKVLKNINFRESINWLKKIVSYYTCFWKGINIC